MATKKSDKTETAHVIVRAKSNHEWQALLTTARSEHWRTLRLAIQLRGWLLAGKPANLDAAKAMLGARGLEDYIEAVADIEDDAERALAAERVASDEGLCEFSRRPGKPGIWIPSNNVKAGCKENWSVLGLRMSVRGSRGALAEGVFAVGPGEGAESDWICVGTEPAGVYTAVSHSMGPKGPISAIKRHEYVDRPLLSFDLKFARAKSVEEKFSDDDVAKMLIHFGEHGLGACRSQGFGRFDIVSIEQIEGGE